MSTNKKIYLTTLNDPNKKIGLGGLVVSVGGWLVCLKEGNWLLKITMTHIPIVVYILIIE